ncbi:DDE transposase family protein [Dapis sp. BLCC M172]|uniref:DDE transposase family protein n=1 Tax=Dapis sp. BLCC M172 TaxID=2975281 RepID=UPI003CECE556
MSDSSPKFYIIKKLEETCEILAAEEVEEKKDPNILETWGPFNSVEEAIARRVGLIRSGKCKPH